MSMQAGQHSVSALATELRIDRRTVAKTLDLARVKPCGAGAKGPLYRMRDTVEALGAAGRFDSEFARNTASLFVFSRGLLDLQWELRRQLDNAKPTMEERRFVLELLARAYFVAHERVRDETEDEAWEPADLPEVGSTPLSRLERWFEQVRECGGPPGPPGVLLEDLPDQDDDELQHAQARRR